MNSVRKKIDYPALTVKGRENLIPRCNLKTVLCLETEFHYLILEISFNILDPIPEKSFNIL